MPGGHQGHVTIRAFRGTRRSSVYRDHTLPEASFARIRSAAAGRGLPGLTSLDPVAAADLDKPTARRVAREADALRRSAALLELDDDLAAIGDVARWCARAGGPAWLRFTPT